MRPKIEILLILALSTAACPAPEEEPAPQAPDPIGAELWRIEGGWGSEVCARPHLYRSGRQVQYQCFDIDDGFSWENRGTLTAEAEAALDAAIAAADLDDTTPADYMGLCGSADAIGTETLWIGDRSVSFALFCPHAGVLEAYEEIKAIRLEISECRDSSLALESIEAGCRAY